MKRILAGALALTLMGTVAASAQSYRGGHGSYGGYDRGYHDNYRSHNNGGALIGLGIGLMALAAIASSSHSHDRDYDRYGYGRDYDGYNNGYYNRGYNGYSNGYYNRGYNSYYGR